METIRAKWFYVGRQKAIRLMVIHCTVSPEMGTGAEQTAHYFQTIDRKASAHRVCDNNSTVLCVRDEDTAFGAAGANADGIHLELVGQPDQTTVQWLDPYSRAELIQAAPTIREWSAEWGVPLRWLSVAEVADGHTRGLCTHNDVSLAFPDVSTGHWDPGPNFPKAEALRIWAPDAPPSPMPPPAQEPTEEDPVLYIRASKPDQKLLVANGAVMVAHGALATATPTTPTLLVDDRMWNFTIDTAKFAGKFLDPR